MKYKYRWVKIPLIKFIKEKIIPLKANKVLFNHIPVIKKGKYKGYMGIEGMVLCMVIQK
jgi:hypothetical protein